MGAKGRHNWDLPVLILFLAGMIALFSPILFTKLIVRAPDILNEFYWGVFGAYGKPLGTMFATDLSTADWNPYINSGHTNNGGMASLQLHYLYRLFFGLVPAPASVAWFMVIHLFLGGAGLYLYCRLVGCSRTASLLGGIVFALCTENASLINAGHVMKIATIAHAPWIFYFLEKGIRSGRWFHYLTAGLVLSLQFFNTHWQIAYYTCLGVAAYVVIRFLAGIYSGEPLKSNVRMLMLSVGMTLFFLVAASISLAPLASWSTDTNRGAYSGANKGKGGLDRDEAMMWSMPPEETAAFIIPGLFGLSRQEGGDQPLPGHTYYWGRMVFTQTASYFGMLPWLLLPLAMIFRSDRVVNTALFAVFGGIIFSMGKYTPFYQFLYDFLPGIDRFRVPKMMMFATAMGLGVLSAIGLDLLLDEKTRKTLAFRRWIWGVALLPILLAVMLLIEKQFGGWIREQIMWLLARPTRYESGVGLVAQRWLNVEFETGLAVFFASLYAVLIMSISRARYVSGFLAMLLIAVFVSDLWRVNKSFFVLTNPPSKGMDSAAVAWLKDQLKTDGKIPQVRVMTLGDADPMSYAAAGVPVLFTANAVQKRRWQEYLDNFNLKSSMPDMMNVKWLVYNEKLYERDFSHFGDRFIPVYRGGGEVILENPRVLPKAWLVSNVKLVTDPSARLNAMAAAQFNPRELALVESAPPSWFSGGSGAVSVVDYDASRIQLSADVQGSVLLVTGEKFQEGWKTYLDGKPAETVAVNNILRGVYLGSGSHKIEFRFDPLPFKVGKWLSFTAMVYYLLVVLSEVFLRKRPIHAKTRTA